MIIFLFIGCVILPFLIILFGVISYRFTPKKINGFFGFRTEQSMKNDETWIFAHKYCGKLWMKLGIGMLITSAIIFAFLRIQTEDMMGVGMILLIMIQTIALIISVIPTQKALRKIFDTDGNRI